MPSTFRQPLKITNVTALPPAGSTGLTRTFFHPGGIRLHNAKFYVTQGQTGSPGTPAPASRAQIIAAISRIEIMVGTVTLRDFSVEQLLIMQDTYLAIGIVAVGLTGFFQAFNTVRSFVGHETGADIRRQIEPTQTADITKIQTDISAIKNSVEEIHRRISAFEKWQVEELRAISDLRARITNLERQTGK